MKSTRGAVYPNAVRRIGIAGALAIALAIAPGTTAGSVSSQSNAEHASFADVVVSPSGRIGPINGRYLRMGVSNEAAVVKAEKRKPNARSKIAGRSGTVGIDLEYRLRIGGSKKTCTRTYDFASSTHRLSDFESNCRYLRTDRGIRIDMSAAKAEGLAGHAAESEPQFGRACTIAGYAITEQRGNNWLAVWMKPLGSLSAVPYGPVTNIHLYGAHSVWWDTCGSAATP